MAIIYIKHKSILIIVVHISKWPKLSSSNENVRTSLISHIRCVQCTSPEHAKVDYIKHKRIPFGWVLVLWMWLVLDASAQCLMSSIMCCAWDAIRLDQARSRADLAHAEPCLYYSAPFALVIRSISIFVVNHCVATAPLNHSDWWILSSWAIGVPGKSTHHIYMHSSSLVNDPNPPHGDGIKCRFFFLVVFIIFFHLLFFLGKNVNKNMVYVCYFDV